MGKDWKKWKCHFIDIIFKWYFQFFWGHPGWGEDILKAEFLQIGRIKHSKWNEHNLEEIPHNDTKKREQEKG